MNALLTSAALCGLFCLDLSAQQPPPATAPAGPAAISVGGQSFPTWSAFVESPSFRKNGRRCGTPPLDPQHAANALLAPSDCAYSSTTPKAEYDPTFIYTIPVVVHVIQRTSGTGYISPAKVQTQIDILNEDFLALPGTNGANGNDGMIQFELATVDPSGNPTTGITYSSNNTWYNDGGNYWNTLAWDTNRYLNIYTNSAQGYLGYVPDLPQGGIVGSNSDRVVILWSSFGRNGPIGPPYNQGRTTTHEVGHYLGLWHPFDGGCHSGSCYTNGDTICDTNKESSPTWGCPGSQSSCGSSDPFHNYLDYSDDLCMWEFTNEQINRMRCTLENWRPDLYRLDDPGNPVCLGDGTGATCPCSNAGSLGEGCRNSTGSGGVLSASGSNMVSLDDLVLHASQARPNQMALFLQGRSSINLPFKDGILCVGAPTERLQIIALNGSGAGSTTISLVTKGAINPGETIVYQLWFRDPGGPCGTDSNLTGAYEVVWQ